jgi:hypothetical protein
MPLMHKVPLANPEDLTVYAVVKESWMTDGRGRSALYSPAKENEEHATIELTPLQAEYLLSSGQIKPIPGETKGYPADAQTGEAIELDAETRARIEAGPSLGEGSGEAVLGEGQPSADETSAVVSNASTDEAAQQPSAQDGLATDTATETVDTKTRKNR